ncbi:GntR family transcriptional regulator [Raoultella sp. BIGb0149]|uniref:GntR family transcriptional regulator n=1 Tax=Raoultella TaxID=160674 RepID=UPI00105E8F66|nr:MULTISPECIES: GntR family transcriptional regulator [Raoultella]MCI1034019.1 GntR family transcriptional regulator [Raoultella terrigena]TDQ26749.1 GntR family transcriptional regulator [Raoultella sp. BIGb0149]
MNTEMNLVRPNTLRRQVENALREAIMSGRFHPGQRLIERELCENLGVSRTSIREALRQLEAEKLICIVPHKGPTVASISLKEAEELYALRSVLEGFAAREFALQGSDASIAQFAQAAAQLRAAAETGQQEEVLRAKTALYDIIFDNCNNSLVKEILTSLHSRVNLLRATSLMEPHRMPSSLAEIDRLAQALRDRDAEQAQAIASLHVNNACQVALQMLRRQSEE